jgi:predicted GH43/DUF377 family glycosyl hydrolase
MIMLRSIPAALAAVLVSVALANPSTAQEPKPVPGREWANPAELRSKKLIDAGIYTLDSKLDSHWLAEHPEFTTAHPFDGIALRLVLAADWCKKEGLPEGTRFDDVVWKTRLVPYEALAGAVADLKRTKWGRLTDNFLWWNLRGGTKKLPSADLEKDDDWKAIEHNAALAARVCKEAGLKGLFFDTEQYGAFPGTKSHYPFGKAKAEVLRKRGLAWMKAVQKECPDVVVVFTFAWAPDLDRAGFLAGVKEFINGMLEGIEGNARLVHGYENTFYYGQTAGSRFTKDGFRGDRARYDEAVASMRKWGSLSSDPKKFEKHVRVGMAAWLESDPWNLWSGWPSGTKDTIWSNLPLALAASEEYVWCWSEHTNYLHTLTDPVPGQTGLNPYLASLTNQTFNTGKEAVTEFDEDFATDPLAKGWYFDFDMLDVARKRKPEHAMPVFLREGVPYHWVPGKKHLHVGSGWVRGPEGKDTAPHDRQRRRFVRPIQAVTQTGACELAIDFDIGSFGTDRGNPIVLGLFHSALPADRSSLSLRVAGPDDATIVMAGKEGLWTSTSGAGLKVGRKYRFAATLSGSTGLLDARLTDLADDKTLCELRGAFPPDVKAFGVDEVGVAQTDWRKTETTLEQAHTYRITHVRYKAKGTPVEPWEMGPFVKREKPILSPTVESVFTCPILKKEVKWESQNVYNPAAVVRDGKVYLLYRADDTNKDLKWGRTCRIGLAVSDDGITFKRHGKPVVFPDNDDWKKYEWEGGCEDLHVVEGPDGVYYMNYTTWSGTADTVSIATSKDLVAWTKHGPAFRKAGKVGGRSGVVVTKLEKGKLVAAKIDGKFWMYYTHPCALAWSKNLIDWTPADKAVWKGGHEAGAIALQHGDDIHLMFNAGGWEKAAWSLGQAVIDGKDLLTLKREAKKPFLVPEFEWEKKGLTADTVVSNALVPFGGKWMLYYGGADRHIGVAEFTPVQHSSFALTR